LHFNRNVTKDFEEAIGPITPNLDINYMSFQITSPENPTGFCELIIDDISFTNGTAYDYMNNGDFETGNGNYWSSYSNGPSSALITNNDSTVGTTSLNLTTSTAGYYGNSYINCERNLYSGWDYFPKGPVVNQPEDVIISFDWKYSDTTNGGTNQEAYFSITGQNTTFSFEIRYYLGEHDDILPNSNSTSSSYIRRCYAAEGFGTRDTWHSFYLDLYDIISEENMLNVPIDDIGFDLDAGYNANSTVQLLVDDVNVICYPTIDPSFEGKIYWAPNDPISLWRCDDHQYTNITSDSHNGNLAANITAFDNHGSSRVYKTIFLPIQDNLYTDFWWKMNTLTIHTSTYSYAQLELNNSYYINYVLGSSAGTTFSNSSNSVYIIIDEHNTIGTWTNLARNVAKDVKEVYGKENLIVTEVTLYCYSNTAGAVVSTIFDDIHFVRDTTPSDISSVVLQNTPTYYEGAIIDVTTSDALNDIAEVVVYYQNETSWYPQLADHLNGDTYRAMIPEFEYGTTCNYYVEVFDSGGNSAIDDNSGANYSYTVSDDIDPYLSVFGPTEGSEISNEVTFYIDASDVGSGISGINITFGDSYSFDNDTIPEVFTFDTTLLDNGEQTAVFTVTDGAGNTFTVTLDYTFANTAPILLTLGILFNWGTLVGAGVVALGFGIYFLVRLIKIKKTS